MCERQYDGLISELMKNLRIAGSDYSKVEEWVTGGYEPNFKIKRFIKHYDYIKKFKPRNQKDLVKMIKFPWLESVYYKKGLDKFSSFMLHVVTDFGFPCAENEKLYKIIPKFIDKRYYSDEVSEFIKLVLKPCCNRIDMKYYDKGIRDAHERLVKCGLSPFDLYSGYGFIRIEG